jgi:hypothetical protein
MPTPTGKDPVSARWQIVSPSRLRPTLFARRKYWAHRFGVAPVLPMSRAEMEQLGQTSRRTSAGGGHREGRMLGSHRGHKAALRPSGCAVIDVTPADAEMRQRRHARFPEGDPDAIFAVSLR